MTQLHFRQLANAIRRSQPKSIIFDENWYMWKKILIEISESLKEISPRFKEELFLKQAGYDLVPTND